MNYTLNQTHNSVLNKSIFNSNTRNNNIESANTNQNLNKSIKHKYHTFDNNYDHID